ncbi:MAG: hypothetical protein IPO05_04450 [Flavobacteriales bacterium]|nr:hypothetical protein [Flavobacteriales bacterium]MBP7448747.1 hypothetical protein [Flavobacteriales bacterium]HOZ41620.1 hypothetical protein [Flavobacteriales bacterium]
MKRVVELLQCAIGLFAITMLVPACRHGKCESGPLSSIGRSSHNAGANCMQCHLPDGEGEVCWKVAGTIYNSDGTAPATGHQVRLFTGPLGTGDIRLSIQSDASGNIYTSEAIAFGNGLFPALIHNGDTAFMAEAISDGACNRCHGSSTDRIIIP